MKWSFKRFIKNMGLLFGVVIWVWLFISVLDVGFAKSMYGDMSLHNYNFFVVMYKTFDILLQGFIF